MSQDTLTRMFNSPRRRQVLKGLGGTVAISSGLAGCLSNEGGENGSADGGGGTTGNTGQSGGSDGEVFLLSNQSNEDVRELLRTASSDFEENSDYSVNIEFTRMGSGIQQRLTELMQAGTPPDIISSSATLATQLVSKGLSEPLTETINEIEDRLGKMNPAGQLIVDDEKHLPLLSVTPCGYFYRDDVYTQEPSSWDTLLQEAKKAQDADATQSSVFVAGGKPDKCVHYFMLQFAYANHAQVAETQDGEVSIVMNDDGHGGLNGEGSNRQKWIETLQFLKQLYQYSPAATDASCTQMIGAIVNGTSASAAYPGWRTKVNVAQQDVEWAGDTRAIQMPGPDGKGHSFLATKAYQVISDGGATEGAKEWVNHFYQQKYLMQFYELVPLHIFPGYRGIRESDEYQQVLDNLSDAWTESDYQQAFKAASKATALPFESDEPNPKAGQIQSSAILARLLGDVTAGDKDPATALEQRANELQETISD